jgi:hypothetical protein
VALEPPEASPLAPNDITITALEIIAATGVLV